MMKELREANTRRQAEWDPDDAINADYRANELAGEAGEACNVLKKLHREAIGLRGTRATKEQLADEVADVVICQDLVGLSLKIVPCDVYCILTPRSLSRLRCRLAIAVGQLCESIEYEEEIETVESYLAHVVEACAQIAAYCEFDLWEAVRRKFNASSEKYRLATRLEYPS